MKKKRSYFFDFVDRFFLLNQNQTSIRQEFLAGFSAFASMAYIIVINPRILSNSGMDFNAVLFATIFSSIVGTLIVALFSNYPFGVAPGMGLNAYFTYGIVLTEGYTWQEALGACFFAGFLLYLLNILGIRELILQSVPTNLRVATSAGIGLFLAFVGFQNIGIVVGNDQTLVTFGNLQNPSVLLFLIGLFTMMTLSSLKYHFAIVWGIFVSTLFGFFLGLIEWNGFVSSFPDFSSTFLALSFEGIKKPSFIPIVFSILFVGVFDATASLLTLGKQGEFLTKEGNLPRVRKVMFGDSFSTMIGSLFGTSPTTTQLESSSAIAMGGKTGLTACFIAFFFFLSFFFTPFFTSIPIYATTPVLVFIGALLMQQLKELNWKEATELFPAFLIIIGIPLTFSIPMGMAFGFIAYPLIKFFSGKRKELTWINWVLAFVFLLKLLT